MEAIAAVSSIVGILGFAGQAITGITRMNDFFLDCRSASKTADRFLKELESLKQAVEQVEGLLKALDHRDGSAVQATLASLHIQLEDCKNDVDGWVDQAEKSRPSFGRGAKSAFKKFLVAVNKSSIKDVFTEIAVHRDNISLKLSIIGRHQGIETSVISAGLKSKLDEVASSSEANDQLTAESLQRLESLMSKFCAQQTMSFGSLESRASRIESLLSFGSESHGSSEHSRTSSSFGYEAQSRDLHFSVAEEPSSVSSLQSKKESSESKTANPHRLPGRSMGTENAETTEATIFCECCPGKLKSFHTMEQLSEHKAERPHKCRFCPRQFYMRSDAERHEKRLHLAKRQWWTCHQLVDVTSAATLDHPASAFLIIPDTPYVQCGYCGENSIVGLKSGQRIKDRIGHLRDYHHFGKCNTAKRFFRRGDFQQHLQHSHGGRRGEWMAFILSKCFVTDIMHEEDAWEKSQTLIDGISQDFRTEMARYIQISQRIQVLRGHARMITSHGELLFPHRPGSFLSEIEGQMKELVEYLEEANLQRRKEIWETGCDFEAIDAMFGHQILDSEHRRSNQIVGESSTGWKKLQSAAEARAWRTQTDRINAWLLQSLQASENQAALHRSYLVGEEKLTEEQWARAVLKFWPLDEAAIWAGDRACSTNGAVDSDGAAHSARVVLLNSENVKDGTDSLDSWHTARCIGDGASSTNGKVDGSEDTQSSRAIHQESKPRTENEGTQSLKDLDDSIEGLVIWPPQRKLVCVDAS